MTAILITYDLNKPGQNYDALYEEIKNLGATWWHYLDSTWIVAGASLTAENVSQKLSKHCDKGDRLLCLNITGDSSQGLLTQDAWDWIKKYV